MGNFNFTPELIAYFQSRGMPLGINNSQSYVNEGILALNYLEQEKEKKKEEILSRSEMHPTLKKKVTTLEAIRGKKDEYKQTPQVIGMSGTDPVLGTLFDFYGAGKTLGMLKDASLWTTAKYFPKTQLGLYGRAYWVNNAMNNSFNSEIYLSRGLIKNDFPTMEEFYKASSEKIPSRLIIGKIDIMPESRLGNHFKSANFEPEYLIKNGKFNEKFGEETINRLKDLGYNLDEPLIVEIQGNRLFKDPIRYIRSNASKPTYVGRYDINEGASGYHDDLFDIAAVDPIQAKSVPSTIFHERNMHGTDNILNAFAYIGHPKARQMYLEFVNKLFYKNSGEFVPQITKDEASGKFGLKLASGDFWPLSSGSTKWYEARATINELKRKYLFGLYKQYGKPDKLETLRSLYLKYIDDLPEETILNDLKKVNGYGYRYNMLKDNNPNFIPDIKEILKYGAEYVTPVAGGLYNILDNNLKQYYKQGGILDFLKNGSGIHIKEKNKGKYFKSINKYVNV